MKNTTTVNFKKKLRTLKTLHFLPRWMILFIDVAIVLLSAVLSYVILKGIGIPFVSILHPATALAVFVGVHLVFFWWFRTFNGIVRHSTVNDVAKLFVVELCVFICLYLINQLVMSTFTGRVFLTTRLLISIGVCYALLVAFRVAVKVTFEFFSAYTTDAVTYQRTVIYGSDERAIAIGNAIKAEVPQKFKLVGFINPNVKKSNTQLLNVPVIGNSRRAAVLARWLGARTLILADQQMPNEEKVELIEDCMRHDVKVYNLPQLTNTQNKKTVAANIRKIRIEDLLARKPIKLNNTQISAQLKDQVILVSGAAGSIGSEIVWQVAAFNPRILILVDQAETPLHQLGLELYKCQTTTQIVQIIADVRNYDSLEKVFRDYRPTIVYHAAAYKHVPLMELNPEQAIFTNVIGSKNMADLALKYQAERFVMVSTDKAVNPSNVMGASKRIAEKYVQSLSQKLQQNNSETTKFITTRFGNVLGSNGSVVPLFTKQIEAGGPITLTHPDIIRYFMTIPEACQLVLEAGSMGKGGEIFIFNMGKPVRIIDLAIKMIQLAGLQPYKDIEIKTIGLRPGEKLYEELLHDTSTTLPTHHPKIMIAQDIKEDYEALVQLINQLQVLASQNLITDAVAVMKKIVPEFKSLNSVYGRLDEVK